MEPLIPRRSGRQGPEHKIQDALIRYLRYMEWFVKPVHGSAYQSGWPDLFCSHARCGHRWIEVKLPNMVGSKYTSAQLEVFPQLCAHGSGVWVLTAATESEYRKLWSPPNWWSYTGVMK